MLPKMQMKMLIVSLILLFWENPVAAQKPLPSSTEHKPDAALTRLAGNWEAQARFWMSTDSSARPTDCTATVNARMIMGGRFLFQKIEGHCMGQPFEAIGVLGHDGATGRYQAVSFSSNGSGISLHSGEKNEAGEIVLHLSYQDQATGATVNRRTVRTMVSENEWLETAHENRNGTDQKKVMEIRARRFKESPLSRP